MDDEDIDEEGGGGGTDECPYCGEEIYEGVAQCPHCRRYITDEDDGDAAVSPRRARRRVPWWVLVGVGLALASTLVLLLR